MSGLAVAGGAAVWDRLRRGLRGRLVLPSDTGYDVARQLYMSEFDRVRPCAVVRCESAEDVRTSLAFAADHRLPAVPRSGGHSTAGWSTTPGLVVDVSRLDTVEFGAETITVGAGTQFVDLLAATAPRGLAVPGGMNPTVGLGGFVQGGGFGLLTRRYGMACDRVVSAEVVLADGRVVRCSQDEHPDLYWAVRGGGGGNFGVVTRFELRPARVSRMVNYTVTWPWDGALRALSGWQRWVSRSGGELGSSLLVVLPDAAPAATPLVMVIGGWTGSGEALEASLDALAAEVGSPPAVRDVRDLTYREAMTQWYECAGKTLAESHTVGHNPEATLPRGAHQRSRNRLFGRGIPDSGLASVLSAFDADRRAGHTRVLNGFALGGEANRPARTDTAYVHRDTEFLFAFGDAIPGGAPDEEEKAAGEAWTDRVFAAADPYANGESYHNYLDPRLADWRRAYYAENYERLSRVKDAYDPARFFRFPQAID
ncbi:FAD-binding oxidoreductase [Streptomyces polygonati]|uniref:FAD-binding oxidoreductase n=1 Tax=Streptomyces polygonati TaxID=1617087 RepID=A0ABV8HKR2_9ACTN